MAGEVNLDAMAGEVNLAIATSTVTMPTGGQVKDSGLRSSPMVSLVPAVAHVWEQRRQVGCLVLL
jgi:hypothetical protein